jgi:hypothetical protein
MRMKVEKLLKIARMYKKLNDWGKISTTMQLFYDK